MIDIITTTPDDTRDAEVWTPLRVSCKLVEPIIYYQDGLNLDGPLQFGAFQEWRLSGGDPDALPPLQSPDPVDFTLPIATWRCGEQWGWCTSDVQAEWGFSQPIPFRGPTCTDPMRWWTHTNSVNTSSGRFKPTDLRYPAVTPDTHLEWYVLGDPDGVARLLRHVPNLGKKHNLGCGTLHADFDGTPQWTVEEIEDDYSIERDGILTRRMPARWPAEGRPGFGPIRAPNWHRARYVQSVEAGARSRA